MWDMMLSKWEIGLDVSRQRHVLFVSELSALKDEGITVSKRWDYAMAYHYFAEEQIPEARKRTARGVTSRSLQRFSHSYTTAYKFLLFH